MASKHLPPLVKHPRFIPVDAPEGHEWSMDSRYFNALVKESLRQAFELTPWEKAVVLLVRRADFQEVAAAVARVAGPEQAKRVYLEPCHQSAMEGKRLLINPRGGTEYLKGTPPWGDPPAAEVDLSPPPAATIGAGACPKCGLPKDGPGLAFTSDGTICDGPDEGPHAHALHARSADG